MKPDSEIVGIVVQRRVIRAAQLATGVLAVIAFIRDAAALAFILALFTFALGGSGREISAELARRADDTIADAERDARLRDAAASRLKGNRQPRKQRGSK